MKKKTLIKLLARQMHITEKLLSLWEPDDIDTADDEGEHPQHPGKHEPKIPGIVKGHHLGETVKPELNFERFYQ